MTKRNAMPLFAEGALRSYLAPRLALDARLDVGSLVRGLTPQNYAHKRAGLKSAITTAVQGRLAEDADLKDIEELLGQLSELAPQVAQLMATPAAPDAPPDAPPDAASEAPPDATEASPDPPGDVDATTPPLDPPGDVDVDGDGDVDADDVEAAADPDADDGTGRIMEFLQGKLSDEDLAAFQEMLSGDDDVVEDNNGVSQVPAKQPPGISKTAMDAAINAAVRGVEQATIARLNAVKLAETQVRPYVGQLAIAQDSAEAVYKLALDTLGIDVKGVHVSAYPAILAAQPKPGRTSIAKAMALDTTAAKGYAERFPDVNRLKKH